MTEKISDPLDRATLRRLLAKLDATQSVPMNIAAAEVIHAVPALLDNEKALALLLLECRDAICCITTSQARLNNISLSLADRIETALEPWKVDANDPRGI